MGGVDLLADLITEDLHGDEVVCLWGIGGVDELAGGLIDRDERFVLVEDMERSADGERCLAACGD